ncbi:MAG: glycosyltransferase family 2 protein [Pirellulales bacterium]
MIVQSLADYKIGYLAKEADSQSVATFFLAGANVAFRKNVLEEIGNYDLECKTGEDAEVCIRVGKTNWELYRNISARVKHQDPSSLQQLFRQWYGYSYCHPYIYKKHAKNVLEILVLDRSSNGMKSCWERRFPFTFVIIRSHFLSAHIGACFCGLAWSFGLGFTSLCFAFLASLSLARYLKAQWETFQNSLSAPAIFRLKIKFMLYGYIRRIALLTGGLHGSLHFGALVLNADHDYQ